MLILGHHTKHNQKAPSQTSEIMPSIIGKAIPVVEIPGLTVRELMGNASTNLDTVSVAHETISQPMSEPWKINQFDEWLCVLKGKIEVKYGNGGADQVLTVNAGETCQVLKGERYMPVFPEAGTEFLATCVPAFKPDRCIREGEQGGSSATSVADDNGDGFPEKIFHMCEKGRWEAAKSQATAYFPPTFEKDGFTHGTADAKSLIGTANHFYQSSKDDWICIEMSRSALTRLGIVTRFEEAKPVGDVATAASAKSVIFPHIFGGIPAYVPGIVTKIFPMTRDSSGKFLAIEGL